MTPPHPLLEKRGPWTRDELLSIVEYEGLISIAGHDMPAARELEAEGLVEVTEMFGLPHVTRRASPRDLAVRSEPTDPNRTQGPRKDDDG